ncbi:MAG TPA: thioesterase family protein [Acetobacteraceae bacterium]|nr:thioesterase family protein [Acetobacteraceae bacterium]
MASFSELIETISPAGELSVPDAWRQGRTTYGGLSAALCVAGVLRNHAAVPPLRAAHFTFLGPAAGALRIQSSLLRQGKNSVFVAADLHGEAGVATRATLAFGNARESRTSFAALPAPAVPPPDGCPLFAPGRDKPRFASQFEIRVARRTSEPDFLMWVRHNDPLARRGIVGLIALADVLPPAAITLVSAAAPVSTITWSVDMVDPAAAEIGDPEGWHLMQSRADHAADGYSSQAMALWNHTGAPVLVARQTVAIFG